MEKHAISFDKNVIKKDMKNIMKFKREICQNIRSPRGEKYNETHLNLDLIDRVYEYKPTNFFPSLFLVARLRNPRGKPIYMNFQFGVYDDDLLYSVFMTQNYKLFEIFFDDEKCDTQDYFHPKSQEELFMSVHLGYIKEDEIPPQLLDDFEIFYEAKSKYDSKPYPIFEEPSSPVVKIPDQQKSSVVHVESHHSYVITKLRP